MKRCFLLSFILFFSLLSAFSQNPAFEVPQVNIASPNVYSINKFGNIPVGYYTGTTNINIPIYKINVGDIHFSISLSYHSSGVKVAEIASWAGLGWNINCNSTITREVKGLPDENGWLRVDKMIVKNIVNTGFLYPTSYTHVLNYDDIMGKFPSNYVTISEYIRRMRPGTGDLDGQPDIFRFSCGNYSGFFYYDYNGNIIQSPFQNLVIKSSSFGQWDIITPEGVTYSYGNDAMKEFASTDIISLNSPSSFFLTQITDQVNNAVYFKYRKYNYNITNFASQDFDLSPNLIPACNVNTAGTSFPVWKTTQTYSCLLDTIVTANEKICFYSSLGRLDIAQDYKLDSLAVFDNNNNQINKAIFYHGNFVGKTSTEYFQHTSSWNTDPTVSNSTYRLRLDSLSINAEVYKFYYDNQLMPDRLSFDCDIWGYYNGANNSTLIPSFKATAQYDNIPQRNSLLGSSLYTSIGNLQLTYLQGADRYPNPSFMTACTLNKIVYPTGGSTSFVYEANTIPDRYSNFISYSFNTLPPNVNDTTIINKCVGGLRIKEIIDYDQSENIVTHKEYSYNLEGDTLSSGLIENYPVFLKYITVLSDWQGCNNSKVRISATPSISVASNTTEIIGYSRVVEDIVTSTDTIRKELKFTDLISKPDVKILPRFDVPNTPYTTQYFSRGLLLSEKDYKYSNGSFSIAKETNNEYTARIFSLADTAFCVKGIVSTQEKELIYGEGVGLPSYDLYNINFRPYSVSTGWNYLKTSTEITYNPADNSKSIRTITNYEYQEPANALQSNVFVLRKMNNLNSKGEQISTSYKYSNDFLNANNSSTINQGVNNLLLRNMKISPVEESYYKTINGSTVLLHSSFIEYHPSLPRVKNIYKVDVLNPISDFVPASIVSNNVTVDSRYVSKFTINQYDDKGNILELQKANDIKKTYIWGYNKTYPVAEVVGAPYSSIMGILNQAVLDNPSDDVAMRSELNKIRINFLSAQVTTYTYKPLVGMTSQTDPNGRTIFYTYDSFGRLAVITDQDDKILRKICYNYAGQVENCNTPAFTNDQQQATFTRNTACAAGLVLPASTYTVPAGTYSSYIDKATANQLAINAMNTNGQAAANALPCLAPFSGWNKTSQPWNVTVTNTAGTFNATYSFYPGSSASLFANIQVGTYNISLAPMNAGSVTSPVQLVLNGTTYTGTSFNVTNAGINAATTLTLQSAPAAPGPCSFSAYPGIGTPSYSFYNNGTTVSFYIVFYSSSQMMQGVSYTIGALSAACRPSSQQSFTFYYNGAMWALSIYPNGTVTVTLVYGASSFPPYTTLGTGSTLTYNL